MRPGGRTTGWRLHTSINAAIVLAMSVAITVRDVPDEVRDELAARAARAGKSLQEYLRAMLVDAASRPPVADVIARARARVDATGARVDAESILAARDADRR
jgi:plasmid stability protein